MDNYKIKVKDEAESKKDATHTCENDFKYICIDERWHLMTTDGWFPVSVNPKALKPIQTVQAVLNDLDELREEYKDYNKDPALISGADVPRLIKEGNQIQLRAAIGFKLGEWKDLDLELDEEEFSLGDLINTRFEWRLKPQTIKLELELPKHFEPKDGDECFIFDSEQEDGFYRFIYRENSGFHENLIQFGAYRSEAEVKQVVEQLRKIRGPNS